MNILEEFKETHKWYEKKYKNQTLFKSMKMVKKPSGNTEPVFYIGVPGIMVAISFAVVVVATVYLIAIPFKWYIWLPYVLAVIFGFRISLKLDKVRQVRYMVYYLMDSSIKLLQKAADEEDESKKQEYLVRAKEWLDKILQFVDEPAVEAQLKAISE